MKEWQQSNESVLSITLVEKLGESESRISDLQQVSGEGAVG
jgi:hypothetical protein